MQTTELEYELPPELIEDRKTFLGFDMGKAAMAPQLPLQIGRLRAQIEDNLAGLRSALAATADVDEEAILAKLLPVVTDALAAKAGPGMTREEVVEILQGITLKAS